MQQNVWFPELIKIKVNLQKNEYKYDIAHFCALIFEQDHINKDDLIIYCPFWKILDFGNYAHYLGRKWKAIGFRVGMASALG